MSHDEAWHAARRLGIGGSDATIIMGGDEEKILRLWREKRGEVEPENLDDVLPVQIGVWTEEGHTNWFERKTGKRVKCRQENVVSKEHPFMRCTLDGVIPPLDESLSYSYADCAVFDAKHVNQFAKKDEPARKYFWQMQHNMLVTGASTSFLSVIFGTFDWEYFQIDAEPLSQAQLIAAERAFWACVETGDPPCVINVPAPVEAVKRVDMTSNNRWGSAANVWLSNRGYAKAFEQAVKDLKELVDADVVEATGHGITASRSRAGAISIRESK